MPAVQEKKAMTERDRRRLRAAQIKKTVTHHKNENTQTNLTYRKIIDKTSEDKKQTRVRDKQSEFDKEGDEIVDEDEISDGEVAIDEKEDASTDASQDSDSSSQNGENAKGFAKDEFLFSGSGSFIKHWTNFVIVLAMYNSVLIPLQIFYKDELPSFLKSNTISIIDACVDFFFLMDIIITFRTSFLDPKQSVEIRDPHIIGRKYLRGSFAIDVISSVPWSSLFQTDNQSVNFFLDSLGLLKLLRLSRLYSTVQRSNLAQDIKVYLKVIMMAIFLLVFMHVLSCIWFFIVFQQERWVQNMDFMYVQQEQAYQGFLEGDDAFWRKYLVLLYTGFYIFGVGEVVPRASSLEFFSGFVLCSLCTIFNAVIIGYMTSYMEELSKKTAELNEKLNLTNTAMLNLNLSRPLKTQITQYIYQTHTTKQLQNELTGFMNQISPVYKRKVTKESFKELVSKNVILAKIKDTYMLARKKAIQAKSHPVQRQRLLEKKEEDKCITQLVVKLESIFTSPDMLYLQQEDEARKNPNTAVDDESGGAANDQEESFMYFIRNGKFSVHVKVEHLKPVADDSEKPQPVTHLIDGDHFGEIGLIFECKRTATVRSENYGTLAMLKKSHYVELTKTFDSLQTLFRHQIFKYQDELSMWLMVEMDKISYFRSLSLFTKQELLAGMERLTFDKGSLICKKDVIADKLILIQQGIVEVSVKYDRRREDQSFVIERLGRGAIINHRSFMIKDDADTDFVCRTTVSCFVLHYDKFKEVEVKRQDLQRARTEVEQELYAPLLPLALDYIFHNNEKSSQQAYLEILRKNQLRVKFKNAIMQQWTKIKDDTAPGNIQDMVDQMLKKKRDSAKDGGDYQKQQAAKEELAKKIERRKARSIEKQEMLEQEAKDSYLNLDQFMFLQKNIEMASKRLKEQQTYIDQMEKKMIAQLENRRKKEEQSTILEESKSERGTKSQFLHV